MASSFYFIGSLQHSPVGGASRAITTQNGKTTQTAVTSGGILRHIKEQAQSAMAKCNLSLEYLKVTEAMAKCNLSLNYSQKIF